MQAVGDFRKIRMVSSRDKRSNMIEGVEFIISGILRSVFLLAAIFAIINARCQILRLKQIK